MTNQTQIKGCLLRAVEALDRLVKDAELTGLNKQAGWDVWFDDAQQALADLQAFIDAVHGLNMTTCGTEENLSNEQAKLLQSAVTGGEG